MRVALVHSPPHGEVPFRHIGLAYLQAVLESAGIDAKTYDISLREDVNGTDFYQDLMRELSSRVGALVDGPDLRLLLELTHPEAMPPTTPLAERIAEKADRYARAIAPHAEVFLCSINMMTQYFGCALAARLKKQGRKVVAGGPVLRFAPLRRLLLRAGVFDAVVEGEGEGIVVPLVRALAEGIAPELPGVGYVDRDGALRESPMGEPPQLDALPFPSFRGTPVKDFVPLATSRGCPRKCSYCSEPFFWQGHRSRAPAGVVEEMVAAAERHRLRNFHFHDDLINGDPRWLDAFLEQLRPLGDRYSWESFCAPEGLDRSRLERMKAAGCVLLKLGVQSFSSPVLKLMQRGRDVAALKAAVSDAARVGISMHFDMLTCFPGETDADHAESLRVVRELFDHHQGLYMSPNPYTVTIGSAVHREPSRYGVRIDVLDPRGLPEPLRLAVESEGPFPSSFGYGIPRETVLRRLADYGELLAKHRRDYLWLGRGANRDRRA